MEELKLEESKGFDKEKIDYLGEGMLIYYKEVQEELFRIEPFI